MKRGKGGGEREEATARGGRRYEVPVKIYQSLKILPVSCAPFSNAPAWHPFAAVLAISFPLPLLLLPLFPPPFLSTFPDCSLRLFEKPMLSTFASSSGWLPQLVILVLLYVIYILAALSFIYFTF